MLLTCHTLTCAHLISRAAVLAYADPSGAGLSSVQYMPRVCGYEPPAVRQPPSLPVLLYREFLELPELRPDTIATIREVLAQQARTEQVRWLPSTPPTRRSDQPKFPQVYQRVVLMQQLQLQLRPESQGGPEGGT